MRQLAYRESLGQKGDDDLRIHDLIAQAAGVRLKGTLRVLVAPRAAIAEEYDLKPGAILMLPYKADRPTIGQARQCDQAYVWLYDNADLARTLYELEQLR